LLIVALIASGGSFSGALEKKRKSCTRQNRGSLRKFGKDIILRERTIEEAVYDMRIANRYGTNGSLNAVARRR
jgi:hypothetical protein